MGSEQSGLSPKRADKNAGKTIDNIYAMFQQSNSVVLMALKQRNPILIESRIKNINSVVEQLLEPFKDIQKYTWSHQVYSKFKRHFSPNFEPLWAASREQFYELLLANCKINLQELVDSKDQSWTYQDSFYTIAAEQIEQKIADTFVGDITHSNFKSNLNKLSFLANESGLNFEHRGHHDDMVAPFEEELSKKTNDMSSQVHEASELSNQQPARGIRQHLGRVRVERSSLILPQTLFIHKMSLVSQEEIFDLLKFYRQFSNTLLQVICSNNLISCPIKNFIACLEEKLRKKKIQTECVNKEQLASNNEESRKVRRTRESNNNIILYELRAFLEAYTEFVWMFLQLHLMEESNLCKIIQSEVLFGIIFKHLWNFVDWISDRGYEFEEAQLELYFQKKSHPHPCTIPDHKLKAFFSTLDQLSGEKHPQQYLKKLVVFYRQVSRDCQNADDLLGVYEEVIKLYAWERGIRGLRLFRMRNIIDKLLKIEDTSLSGGEIVYSWTTWCIMIELLIEKVSYKYGALIIPKKANGELMKLRESQLSVDELRLSGKGAGEEGQKELEKEVSGCCGTKPGQC